MKHIYTFAEVDGSRLAATADRDGANLPGGPKLWKRLGKFAVDGMSDHSGVTAMGNAEEILRDVQYKGLYLTASRPPDRLTGQGYARHSEDPEGAN